MAPIQPVEPVVIGRITSVYGVRGWVKIQSFTRPQQNILNYRSWWIRDRESWRTIEIDDTAMHGKAITAHIGGIDDRDQARFLCGVEIATELANLPKLPPGEFYHRQLIGLAIQVRHGENTTRLGVVKDILETGANDVLVVKGDAESLDRRERLIPYIDGVVLAVDPANAVIEVDWDPDF